MYFFRNIMIRLFREEPIHRLGRWNIHYCSKMNTNIDFSNNDHSICFRK